MRILLDENIPRQLCAYFRDYGCRTVAQSGWAGIENGELLDLAEAHFDVFVTLDRSIPYQQNMGGRDLALLIMEARSNRMVT